MGSRPGLPGNATESAAAPTVTVATNSGLWTLVFKRVKFYTSSSDSFLIHVVASIVSAMSLQCCYLQLLSWLRVNSYSASHDN